MKRVLLVTLAVASAPALTFGQWLYHPTPGVPRLGDGNPNLTAPAPRMADGRPDFSGIWQSARTICLENEKSSPRMRAQ